MPSAAEPVAGSSSQARSPAKTRTVCVAARRPRRPARPRPRTPGSSASSARRSGDGAVERRRGARRARRTRSPQPTTCAGTAGDVGGGQADRRGQRAPGRGRAAASTGPPVSGAPSADDQDRDDADAALLPHGARGQRPGADQRVRRPDARVTGEGQLGVGGEDPHPVVGAGARRRSTNEVSDRWNSLASAWHCAVVSPSASSTTASGLPANGRGGEDVDDLVVQHGGDGDRRLTAPRRWSLPSRARWRRRDHGARAYVSRLAGLTVFDPNGDRVGKVRDVVVALRVGTAPPARARPGRRGRRPPPDLRARWAGSPRIDAGRGDARLGHAEPQALRAAGRRDAGARRAAGPHGARSPTTAEPAHVVDAAHRADPHRRLGARPARRPGAGPARPPRAAAPARLGRGRRAVACRRPGRAPRRCIATYRELNAADLAHALQELPIKRRHEVAEALDDERLADVLGELPEADQIVILRHAWTRTAPPTSWRRWTPTTPPTCWPSCPTSTATGCWS